MMDRLDPATISIVLIEDDRRIRDGLRVLLDGTSGFRCINAWRSMEEALAHDWNSVPAVALIDIGLPGISGIEGLALLRERYPAVALVVLTVFDDDERIFNALCAGACGYLLKGTPPVKLLESIREVVAGGAPMSPEIARRVVNLFRTIRPPDQSDYSLTPHELRILKLLVDGHSYKSAGSELGVAFHNDCIPRPEHLPEASGPLKIGGRGQGASVRAHQIAAGSSPNWGDDPTDFDLYSFF
jgi:DNA-binding NarL/FixJ family response regulator